MLRSLSRSNSSRGRILRPQRNKYLMHQLPRLPLPTSRMLNQSANFMKAKAQVKAEKKSLIFAQP